MNQKRIDLNDPGLCTHLIKLLSETGAVLATGTGFIYEWKDMIYLITNGHNVTGWNNTQTKKLSENTVAFPVKLTLTVKVVFQSHPNFYGLSPEFDIPLYTDENYKIPLWFFHPEHGYLVDVVAIPIQSTSDTPSHIRWHAINKIKWDSEFTPTVSDDIFILGYPFSITSAMGLPIWKKGSVASYPAFPTDKLPFFYVDTATRSGMSGAPVIFKRNGIHGLIDTGLTGGETIGEISNFIGIYSGRLGAKDEFEAQLGIVWHQTVIGDILENPHLGDINFQNKSV